MTQKQAHKVIRSFLMLLVILAPAASAQQVYEVDGTPGYNCWPMIQPVGDRIVCIYTIGKAHNPWEKGRAASDCPRRHPTPLRLRQRQCCGVQG